MQVKIQVIAITVTVIFLVFVFELVRKRKLREEYSLLWLMAGLCLLIFSLDRPLVAQVSRFLGISYAPSALFIMAFFFGLALAIHFSIIVSHLTDRVRTLAQQNALLRLELMDIRNPPVQDGQHK